MHALNRSHYLTPVVVGNNLRSLVSNGPARRAAMPCILLALPNTPLPFMAAAPDTDKQTKDRLRCSASGRDHSRIWLRNAATGLCPFAAAAAVVSFTAQFRMVHAG